MKFIFRKLHLKLYTASTFLFKKKLIYSPVIQRLINLKLTILKACDFIVSSCSAEKKNLTIFKFIKNDKERT